MLMVYTGAPQNTRRKEIGELRIDEGISYAEKAGIREIVIHAPYIINLGNMEKPEMFDFGVEFLAKEVKRAAAFHSKVLVLHPGSSLSAGVEASVESLPGNYYNFHPGSHVGGGVQTGIDLISDALNQILFPNQSTIVLLETMAGKGSEVGRTFEELRKIYDRVERKDRLRVCFDTCHVNDAGYDLVNDYEGVLAQFDRVLGLSRLRAVHLNDDKNEIGSHRDRHEKIGQGSLGKDVFARIINDKALKDLPFILETPNELAGFKEEIAMLKSWRND